MTPPATPAFSQASFDAALARFVAKAQAVHDQYQQRIAPGQPGKIITAEPSKKYTRIWKVSRHDATRRDIYGFVDQTTGDVYSAESYRKPAPRIRGNIFAPDGGARCLGWSGAS